MFCSNCGREFEGNFCPYCGTAAPRETRETKCPECGRSRGEGELFCPKCGHKFDGAVNFAFIGQFAETPRDTIFTIEYSMRTGMESVYTLLDIDRAVPEVWGSVYDVRELLKAVYYALDRQPLTSMKLSLKEKILLKDVTEKIKGTDAEKLIKESGLL